MIILIYPYETESFYINPLLLQKIGNIITDVLKLPWEIIDVRVTEILEFDFSNSNVYIIDTEYGFNHWIEHICTYQSEQKIIFVGNAVDYSNPMRFLNNVYQRTFCKCYALPMQDEYQIVDALKYLFNPNEKKPEQLLYYNFANNEYFNQNVNKCICKKRNRIKFQKNIYEQYEEKGFQIFLEAFSRGCDNSCNYCHLNNCNRTGNGTVAIQSNVHEVIAELQSFSPNNPVYIQFKDENFFCASFERINQIEEFINKLEDISFYGYIGIDTRLDSIVRKENLYKSQYRKQVWQRFAASGLKYCYLGIETFSEKQSLRYKKNQNLDYLFESLDFLESEQVSYTLGLIIWNSQMTIEDLNINLNMINSHNLYGKVASLLKEMRVQIDSSYLKSYPETVKKSFRTDDFIHINREDIIYQNQKISSMLPIIRYVYDLFNKNGYRHSDVALFEPLYSSEIIEERIIPTLVTKMEYEIIKHLLENDCIEIMECKRECDKIIEKYLESIFEILYQANHFSNNIHNYYISVFNKIKHNLCLNKVEKLITY